MLQNSTYLCFTTTLTGFLSHKPLWFCLLLCEYFASQRYKIEVLFITRPVMFIVTSFVKTILCPLSKENVISEIWTKIINAYSQILSPWVSLTRRQRHQPSNVFLIGPIKVCWIIFPILSANVTEISPIDICTWAHQSD